MSKKPAKKKPLAPSLEGRAYLTLLHAADSLLRQAEETLKPAGLSHTQYNVLRILRGAMQGAKHDPQRAGLPCGEIAARMITRDPDMTRLLDRMEARGMVERARQQKDRRVVQTRITDAGLQLLKELDKPVAETLNKLFRHIPASHQRQLLLLLEEIRTASEQLKACKGEGSAKEESNTIRDTSK